MSAYQGPQTIDLEPDDDTMLRFLSWWFGRCNRGLIEIVAVDPKYGAPTVGNALICVTWRKPCDVPQTPTPAPA